MQAPAVPLAAPAFGSGALNVSPTAAHIVFPELRAATVAARAAVPNTTQAYGDSVNYERGIPREWWAWCQAGPGVDVAGHVTPPNKEVYNALVTPEKVEMPVVTHFALRGQVDQRQALFSWSPPGFPRRAAGAPRRHPAPPRAAPPASALPPRAEARPPAAREAAWVLGAGRRASWRTAPQCYSCLTWEAW